MMYFFRIIVKQTSFICAATSSSNQILRHFGSICGRIQAARLQHYNYNISFHYQNLIKHIAKCISIVCFKWDMLFPLTKGILDLSVACSKCTLILKASSKSRGYQVLKCTIHNEHFRIGTLLENYAISTLKNHHYFYKTSKNTNQSRLNAFSIFLSRKIY